MRSSAAFNLNLLRVLLVCALLVATIRCRDVGSGIDPEATITVYVHWGVTPIPKTKIELIQTGEVKLTDVSGLAEFKVPPGSYVVRVYGINRGGPVFLYVDFAVDLQPSERRMIDVIDCLACA
jgi:hypothetical protein